MILALTYKLRLLQPMLASSPRAGEPNSAVTYDFIPGSLIRGAVIGAYAAATKPIELKREGEDTEAFRLFFGEGCARFLNAYLAHPLDGTRMLPRPAAWFVPKDSLDDPTASVYDFALEPKTWDAPAKPPRGDYFWASTNGEGIQLAGPQIEERVLNASTDRDRKLEGQSQVFRYELLAAGQEFAGVVLCEDQARLETIKPLLENRTFRVGGGKTNAYGKVAVGPVGDPLPWEEYEPAPPDEERDTMTVTCLSDVILRGACGQPAAGWKAYAGVDFTRGFYALRLVGGFNRAWGLPLPLEWAFAAGSVFVFPRKAGDRLAQWVERGVGERRNEGFGRIALNLNGRACIEQSPLPRKEPLPEPITLTARSAELARGLAKRKLAELLDRYIAAQVAERAERLRIDVENDHLRLPHSAQLMRARLAARRAWETGDLERITAFFQQRTELAKRSWHGACIGAEPLEPWIEQLLKQQETFTPEGLELPAIAGEKASLTPQLRAQTIARLIEGVLKQAAKAARMKDEEGQATPRKEAR